MNIGTDCSLTNNVCDERGGHVARALSNELSV